MYEFDWAAVYRPQMWLNALAITAGYSIVSVVGGILLGVILGVAYLSNVKILKWLIGGYVQIFRCTPLLVQIVWFFYALPMLTGVSLSSWLAAALGLTLYMGAFATEIFRAGVMSIDKGQWHASLALGMSPRQMMQHIILPQAIRRMVPPLVSQSVIQVKNTSLLYVVAVPDLMYTSSIITSSTYRPLESYTFVAAIYFMILYPFTLISKRLETRNDK